MIQNPVNYTISGGGGIMNLIPGISQGMTLGNQFAQIQQNQLAAQQAQDMALAKAEEEKAKAARLAEIRAKIADRTFTPGDLAEYAEKVSPEAAKQVREYITTLSEQERDGHLSSISKPWAALASGEPTVAKDLIGMTIEGYKRTGDEEAVAYLTNVQNDIDEDPNGALESLSIFISAFPKGKDVVQSYIDQKAAPGDRDKTLSEKLLNDQRAAEIKANVEAREWEKKYSEGGKIAPDKIPAAENDLNDRYSKAVPVQNSLKMKTFYETIKGAENTKPGDIALVYNFMKMQDPGSTVMAGEQVDARNAGGVDAQVRDLYNALLSNSEASIKPDVRAKFISQARAIYDKNVESAKSVEKTYRGIAERRGLNPDNLGFYDFTVSEVVPKQEEKTEEVVVVVPEKKKVSTSTTKGVKP